MLRLIAAHPRSGQNYISRVMQKTGLEMGVGFTKADGSKHYKDDPPYTDGMVSFMNLDKPIDVILHQVRHPLDTIASAMTEGAKVYQLMFHSIGRRPQGTEYKKFFGGNGEISRNPLLSMWTWLNLNEKIEQVADYRYMIEDIDEEYARICQLLKVDSLDEVPDVPRNFNTKPHKDLSWLDLMGVDSELAQKIREKSRAYGYMD